MGKMYLFEADYSINKWQSIFVNKFVKLKNAPQKDLTKIKIVHIFIISLYFPLFIIHSW